MHKYQCLGCGKDILLYDYQEPFECPDCGGMMQYMYDVDDTGNPVFEIPDDD